MTLSFGIIRTRRADVYGDDISDENVDMQTGNHKGQTRKVRKNVTIDYEKPGSWKKVRNLDNSGSKEVVKANIATVNAKEIRGPWAVVFNGRRQKKIQAKRDVTIKYQEVSSVGKDGRIFGKLRRRP